MRYVIAALELHDYKALHEVTIKPAADATWILLGGDNANGKTSVIDAIEALLNGADAVIEDPVRHGAEQAVLMGKLQPDGDAPVLTVKRVVHKDGSTVLEVRDDVGKVKSPQTLLDSLLGRKLADPLAFLRLKPPDQRAELLKLIDADGEIAKLDQRRSRVFDRRTEVGRDVKRTAAAVASSPEVTLAEPIDVAALSAELQKIGDDLAEDQRILNRYTDAQRELKAASDAVGQAELALERAQKALARAQEARRVADDNNTAAFARLPDADLQAKARQRRNDIQTDIKTASEHNQRVASARSSLARRAELVAEHAAALSEQEKLGAEIETIDATKRERLLAAKLPVDGLGFTDSGVTYRGAPLSSASGAERICVAIAMVAAAQPKLRDIWIRDAAVLDDSTMRVVAEFARTHGIRPWLERISTRDPGVIEIREGRVAEPAQGRLL